jgi:hypothetical protein
MATSTQKVVGAGQFTGLAGAGLFSFANLSALPLTTQIAVSRIAYHAVAGGNVGSEVYFAWTNPIDPDGFILAGRALNASIVAPDTSGDYVVCGGLVPREITGQTWELRCYTVGKDVDATITIDWQIVPMPHSSERDSLI